MVKTKFTIHKQSLVYYAKILYMNRSMIDFFVRERLLNLVKERTRADV